jgi:hypothetical protein
VAETSWQRTWKKKAAHITAAKEQRQKRRVVAHACHSSYAGKIKNRIAVQARLFEK